MKNSDMPAMPVKPEVINGNHQVHFGLSKREHFAAMAMQGLLAQGYGACDEMKDEAIASADLLLAALEES
jgi:hypothetical protein